MHSYGISPERFQSDAGLNAFWNVLSVNKDKYGETFVSAMEAKNYPFFGLQFHPEKLFSIFSSSYDGKMNRSWSALNISKFFSNFFVGLARSNTNTFANSSLDLENELVENFKFFRTPQTDWRDDIYIF